MPEIRLSDTYKVQLIESERGWGQRVNETKYFDNLIDAEQFVDSFNATNNLTHVPDWYMCATTPVKVN